MASDVLSGIFQGLAQGAPQGARLGFLGREQAMEREKLALAKNAAAAEAQKEKMKADLDKGKFFLDAFKEAPPKIKPQYFKAFVNFANQSFGTALNPDAYDEDAANDLGELSKLMEMRGKGLMNDDDFFFAAGQYMTGLDEKQQARAKTALAPIVESTRQNRTAANQKLAGEQLLGVFATRQVLKQAGLTDAQIDDGQANGKIPRNLPAKDAGLIIPRGINFNFGAFGRGTQTGGLDADTLSTEFGF